MYQGWRINWPSWERDKPNHHSSGLHSSVLSNTNQSWFLNSWWQKLKRKVRIVMSKSSQDGSKLKRVDDRCFTVLPASLSPFWQLLIITLLPPLSSSPHFRQTLFLSPLFHRLKNPLLWFHSVCAKGGYNYCNPLRFNCPIIHPYHQIIRIPERPKSGGGGGRRRRDYGEREDRD